MDDSAHGGEGTLASPRGPAIVACDTIFGMRRLANGLILVMLLAALPLRGYAGVWMVFCEENHSGATAALEHSHQTGEIHHHDSDHGAPGSSHVASACSMCAAGCASASLAPDANHSVAFPAPGTDRIPFFDRRVSGFVPEHVDRPPLPL